VVKRAPCEAGGRKPSRTPDQHILGLLGPGLAISELSIMQHCSHTASEAFSYQHKRVILEQKTPLLPALSFAVVVW